ncbi:MATE family efflux transporter [Ruminococcus flavefaciens]|uniref:Putative efflux protein, MATE family n=1 Tax=Ruminococcus flavefaciens TaxID=1265 RepID=A0A1M7I2J1_RUMFL|nr:MATE family efflux transporter [Ruminococcus flavefaciens]SHM34974.1 putative efflux protein, MATE family [Ruminococcus flavefaciens]
MNIKPIRNDFFMYILANVISSIGVSIYILIDTFFISKGMGAQGLAALNLALPVFNFLNGFGLMLGMGGGSKFSMLYCRTERIETDRIFTNAFISMLAVSAVFEIIGIFFSKQFTHLLGADTNVFRLSHDYLKTILLFSPAFLMNNIMACFMRNDSAPKLAMLGMLSGSLANIILDYVFIFKLGMGMRGAALATCISPFVSMSIMSIHIITGWNAFSLRIMRPSWSVIKEIMSLGLHSFFTEISGGLVLMVFNFVIHRLMGNTGIAAYGVIANIGIVFTAVFVGLSSGAQPLMCRYHGKNDEKAINYILCLSIRTALVLAAVSYLLIYTQTSNIVSLFNSSNDSKMQSIAENGLKIYFLFMPFMGANTIMSVYFMSDEKPHSAQIISLLRGTFLVIPAAFIAYFMQSIGLVWLAVPISEMLTMVTAVGIFHLRRRKKRIEKLWLAYNKI